MSDGMMTLKDFLDRVIEDGIKACSESYKDDQQKREGAVAGFEACRNKTTVELRVLLQEAAEAVQVAYRENRDNYWYHRCYQAEVEWVCNVVSSALDNAGKRPIVPPTARGYMQAAKILGVSAFNARTVN